MILEALTTILAPISILVIPGVALLPYWRAERPLLLWSLIALSSLGLTVLATLAAALLGFSQIWVFVFLLFFTIVALLIQQQQLRQIANWRALLIPVVIFLCLLLIFSLPFIFFHNGLPTGDIQKSIIWARDILTTGNLPNYHRAINDFNRDPVDFYTPGLHTLLAYVLSLNNSPSTAGFFALVIALAVTGIAATLARQIFPRLPALPLNLLTLLLILTNLRFLRYLREPGYHIQNSVGDLLFFGTILLGVLLIARWRKDAAVILCLSLMSLVFVHQFTLFISFFALMPVGLALVLKYARHHRMLSALSSLAAVAAIIMIGVTLKLHQKIPHIFSVAPHMLNFTPTGAEYFSLLGPVWFAVGLGGLILLITNYLRARPRDASVIIFAATSVILLLLSQAPRFYIDIPPIRALYYIIVPFAITGAYFTLRLAYPWRFLLFAVLLAGSFSSTRAAYNLSHHVRTNSTLLPEQLQLVETLQNEPGGAILIDDYNRRSSSWLALSSRPMYARIAADIGLQMAESGQSLLRHRLYLNQLDFEKIFSFGSHPAVANLMAKHNIHYVAGVEQSSRGALAHNPALTPFASGGDIEVYTSLSEPVASRDSLVTPWLLRASTLVNDIGDQEDTFEHLPASVRAARLSEPLAQGSVTFRTTTARYIPLAFNIGDYVAALWDQDGSGQADLDIQVLIEFAAKPSDDLVLHTSVGTTYAIPNDGSRPRLPADEVPIDDRGFITLTLENPTNQLVSIDLIAVGLVQIP